MSFILQANLVLFEDHFRGVARNFKGGSLILLIVQNWRLVQSHKIIIFIHVLCAVHVAVNIACQQFLWELVHNHQKSKDVLIEKTWVVYRRVYMVLWHKGWSWRWSLYVAVYLMFMTDKQSTMWCMLACVLALLGYWHHSFYQQSNESMQECIWKMQS